MTSKHQAERSDAMAMQREKERERRRLRDRERRQNMTLEQRERHLARRRRNYQLRRLRAQNNTKSMLHPSQTNDNTNSSNAIEENLLNNVNVHYVGSPALELPSISDIQEGAHDLRKSSRRLSLSSVRHLARRLHCDDNNQLQNEEAVLTKRMSLNHVKRLARALKVSVS